MTTSPIPLPADWSQYLAWKAEQDQRGREQGAYWLTPIGRTNIRETWDSPIELDPPPVLLTALEQAEGALAAERQAREAAEKERDAWRENYHGLDEADRKMIQRAIDANRRAEAAEARAEVLRSALAELVELKDLKDEESRQRQRRVCFISRDAEALAECNAMRDDYNRRKPLAWAAARAALQGQQEAGK